MSFFCSKFIFGRLGFFSRKIGIVAFVQEFFGFVRDGWVGGGWLFDILCLCLLLLFGEFYDMRE